MSDELKPCPFCGGKASISWRGNVHSTRKITIKCDGCRYQRTDAALRYGDEWLLDVAVTAWNARAAESASQAAAPVGADPDQRALDAATEIMGLVEGPKPIGGRPQLKAKVQCAIHRAISPAEFALRALVAAGHVEQRYVDLAYKAACTELGA